MKSLHLLILLISFVVLFIFFVLFYIYYRITHLFSNTSKNPFRLEVVSDQEPQELITDASKRDSVLKQGFSKQKIPDEVDAIVIGSGIGGLTTAVLLGKSGKKVLVLEQHDQAGGCCHSYVEKGFEFDVGIHYIGEMGQRDRNRILVDHLTDNQLQWVPLDNAFDSAVFGTDQSEKNWINLKCGNHQIYKNVFYEAFPNERAAIDKFFDIIADVRRNSAGGAMVRLFPYWIAKFLINTGLIRLLTKNFKYARMSTQEVLDSLTHNGDLKAALCYCFGDYGTPPSESPITMHAALIDHYQKGAYYPRGGASEIAFHMIPVIEKYGGKVLVRAPVSEILIHPHDRHVIGVRVHKSRGDVDIHAPLVISAAGVANTFQYFLPKHIASTSRLVKHFKTRTIRPSPGALSLFIGLDGTKEELGLRSHNLWAYASNDFSGLIDDWKSKSLDEVCNDIDGIVPFLFISFPSAKDPTWNDRYPGKSACTVITLAPWEWFEQWQNEPVKKRGETYEGYKSQLTRRMWNQITTIFPQLEGKAEYYSLGTPLSDKYYLGAPKGEIYGLDHTTKRFSAAAAVDLRPETDIKGLYLTGQDTYCDGFTGALYSGVLTSCVILDRDLLRDMNELVKYKRKLLERRKEEKDKLMNGTA